MAIAITIDMNDWESPEWVRDQLAPALPGVDIRCWPDIDPGEDIEMLITDKLTPGVAERMPNLKLVQKLGAGAESMVRDPDLAPGVRIARLKSGAAAREITEYALHYVLGEHRHVRQYAQNQRDHRWKAYAPKLTPDVSVAVLGLGHIGGRIARAFAALEFRTIGWSRSPKNIEGVDCRAGDDALKSVLGESDYVVSILPSTQRTRGLMNADTLAVCKSGATLINVGRGDLIVDDDLLAALAQNCPTHAVLDVFHSEPLPVDHPYWDHPQVTITPHVSGWNVIDGMADVAENYRRMKAGEPLLHEIDRGEGY